MSMYSFLCFSLVVSYLKINQTLINLSNNKNNTTAIMTIHPPIQLWPPIKCNKYVQLSEQNEMEKSPKQNGQSQSFSRLRVSETQPAKLAKSRKRVKQHLERAREQINHSFTATTAKDTQIGHKKNTTTIVVATAIGNDSSAKSAASPNSHNT